MTYHPLANETGGDDFARNREAHKIVRVLGLNSLAGGMRPKEAEFIKDCYDRLEQYDVKAPFTVKQIFWLRDLKAKYFD